MTNLITTQINQLAERFELPQSEELYQVLKATAFKVKEGEASDAQLSALLIVAKQYGLNPWTKEIYAFPDKKNGIIPVVSVDGWSHIINCNPAFDGIEFKFSDEMVLMDGAKSKAHAWTECIIYRKDRNRPTVIREYLDEVYKAPFKGSGANGAYAVDGPWQSHPKRFLRHKAMIQCARVAFGFGGIYDQDEADRIAEPPTEKFMGMAEVVTPETPTQPTWPDDKFAERLPVWKESIVKGKTVEGVITFALTKGALTDDQMAQIKALPAQILKEAEPRKPDGRSGPAASYAQIADAMRKAGDMDALNEAAILINAIADKDQQGELNNIYDQCASALN